MVTVVGTAISFTWTKVTVSLLSVFEIANGVPALQQ